MTLAAVAARQKRNSEAVLPDLPTRLLGWYNRHRRQLPWRALPGEAIDPYRVWLSEIMLQQTNVKTVAPYFAAFIARWPTVAALAAADRDDVLKQWAGLGYYSRARNLHACAIVLARDHGERFPDTESGLRTLPGVGPYTAAAIAAIAFGRATMPVDGNIERVVTRLFAIEEPLPKAKAAVQRYAQHLAAGSRTGDCAQALMDLGSTTCTPKRPACALCPLNDDCAARARGDPESFPCKAAKTTGAQRRGAAYIVLRGDEVLLRTRADSGLLGGMTEVPSSAWRADWNAANDLSEAPILSRLSPWQRRPGIVRHVFTHFPLELTVYVARVSARTKPPQGMRFVKIADLPGEALPTLMRKVVAHGVRE